MIFAIVLAFAVFSALSVSQNFQAKMTEEISDQIGIKPQKSWAGQYLAGFHATRKNDYINASKYFSESLKLRAQSDYLRARAMNLLLVSGKYSEAIQLAEGLADAEEASTARFLLLASKAKDGEFEEIKAMIDEISGDSKPSTLHSLMRAWASFGMGNKLDAQNQLKKLHEQDSLLENLINFHYALISDLSGNQKVAEELYGKLFSAKTHAASFLASAYHFYEKTGDSEKQKFALEKYNKAIGNEYLVTPPNPVQNPLEGMANLFVELAKIISNEYYSEKTASFLRMGIYLNPDLDEAKILLGSILIAEGDYNSANNVLSQVRPESGMGDFALLSIVRNFEALGQELRAREYLQELIDSELAVVEALVNLGDMERKKSNFEKAAEYYSQAIERRAEETQNLELKEKEDKKFWGIYFARGVSYERLKQWELAEADFKKALELYPDQPDVLNYLGYSWVDMGVNLADAKQMILKAYQQRPNDAHITDSVGWALYKLGEYERAVKYLERAAQLMPYDPVVNDHLGDVYWKVGREKEAKFMWQRALDNKPEAKYVEAIKSKLENGMIEVVDNELVENEPITEAVE